MQSKHKRARGGFTLVELLTVLAIIVLLVGILIPAINLVRQQANSAATQATLASLETGLEQFKADPQVGGSYVPSASDDPSGSTVSYEIESPFQNTLQGFPTGYQEITGAGLLVGGLAGFDLLGTVGFRSLDSVDQLWSDDLGDVDLSNGQPGGYALDPATRKPERPRVGPFVDLQKVDVTTWNPNAQTASGTGSFEIPAELEAAEALGIQAPRRLYPMFLDRWGQPILYFRADPAGQQAVDAFVDRAINPNFRGRFHYRDNGPLLEDTFPGPSSNELPLLLRPTSNQSQPHNLRWTASDTHVSAAPDPQDDYGANGLDWNFWAYTRNNDVQARVWPHNPDTYLLISAGPDGIFGSADDIANFSHNGEALSSPN